MPSFFEIQGVFWRFFSCWSHTWSLCWEDYEDSFLEKKRRKKGDDEEDDEDDNEKSLTISEKSIVKTDVKKKKSTKNIKLNEEIDLDLNS